MSLGDDQVMIFYGRQSNALYKIYYFNIFKI